MTPQDILFLQRGKGHPQHEAMYLLSGLKPASTNHSSNRWVLCGCWCRRGGLCVFYYFSFVPSRLSYFIFGFGTCEGLIFESQSSRLSKNSVLATLALWSSRSSDRYTFDYLVSQAKR